MAKKFCVVLSSSSSSVPLSSVLSSSEPKECPSSAVVEIGSREGEGSEVESLEAQIARIERELGRVENKRAGKAHKSGLSKLLPQGEGNRNPPSQTSKAGLERVALPRGQVQALRTAGFSALQKSQMEIIASASAEDKLRVLVDGLHDVHDSLWSLAQKAMVKGLLVRIGEWKGV